MNKYQLQNDSEQDQARGNSMRTAAVQLLPMLKNERWQLVGAALAIAANSTLTLVAPTIVGKTIDQYIQLKQFDGVMRNVLILTAIYLTALVASYAQTRLMGGVGQRVLFTLRNAVFTKLQDLPVAFFQQNKAGDLISRINNDTDKLGQFFSQSLMQFIGNIFIILGSAVAVVVINPKLGLVTIAPAILLLIISKALGPWVKRQNASSLKSVGGMSAEIQESLNNFKVVVAFNRRDYFRQSFQEANEENYKASIKAGIANNTFVPIYGFASNLAIVFVLLYAFHLISVGAFTIGLLISYLTYINRLYEPLRQMAALWTSFQVALAAWDRINAILLMESDLHVVKDASVAPANSDSVMAFKNVTFQYNKETTVLNDINFTLEPGKTYALVGPTGGGKTTTASLMARLYDPTSGAVLLHGKDIRSYSPEERAEQIGFILQEPYIFSGTVGDNLRYGNPALAELSDEDLASTLTEQGLNEVLTKFDKGTATVIEHSGESMSLGQKQLIAFVRALLRKPALLILDEATANIDTVTEQLLEDILRKLPTSTTRVVIAHRLNTIADADTIFFVNGGNVTEAGSMEQAVDMLLHGERQS